MIPTFRRSSLRRVFSISAAVLVLAIVLVAPALAAPTPTVTLDLPDSPFLGEPFTFTATFDNTGAGAQAGYGPYIDLFLPIGGADGTSAGGPNDGASFISATYLGTAVTSATLTCAPGATINHPYVPGMTVVCPALPVGFDPSFTWQFVSLQLPFGSFTPGQPPAEVTITADMSDFADLDKALPFQSRGVFRYGNDPLDNPGSDPAIVTPFTQETLTPTLMTLDKVYIGPEDETATGPNFPRRYELNVNIADAQTIDELTVTDELPGNLQYIGIFSTTPAATCTTEPSTTTPGGTLVCVFDNPVTGSTAAVDAQVVFEFYAPLLDNLGQPVLNAATGDDALAENQAQAEGDWTPLDPRDLPTIHVISDATTSGVPEHILELQSQAIQKSVANLTDSNNSPGDVLEYTLEMQISDYFAFEDLFVDDTFSDGQHFDTTFAPTLVVSGNGVNLGVAAMAANNVDITCHYTGAVLGPGCDTISGSSGTTAIRFDVSDEMIDRGANGQLLGGCVPTGGGADYDCSPFNDGPTTATLVFRTIIQDDFTDDFPSGDASVDQGDILTNGAIFDGAVLRNSDLTPTGSREDDDTAASVVIARGQLTKTVYAVKDVVCNPQPCSNVQVGPQENVTYRLRYTLPTSDFEDLTLADFMPLPVLDATTVTSFSNTICGVPAAGSACLGPADSYHLLPMAVVPTISTDADANSVSFAYGDYDIDPGQPSVIDLLITVTVSDGPFADGLFLTNEAHAFEGSTNAGDQVADAIVQILLKQPAIARLKKGIITSTNPAADTFNPDPPVPAGTSVSAPGGACPRLGGTLTTSANLASRFQSDVSGLDAGDIVTFAVVVENVGRFGAFDVKVKDDIPAGLQVPPGGVNLCVTDGTYDPFPYTNLGGAPPLAFNIELNDPGPTNPPAAGLDPGKDVNGNAVTSGRNLAIITFDLQIADNVTPNQAIINTATLFNYSGVEGGPDYTPEDKTDQAQTQIPSGGRTKYVVGTSEAGTSAVSGTERVTIGEIVRYRLVWRMPETTVSNAQFKDNLPTGLTFLDDGTARVALVANGPGIASANRDAIPAIDTATCTVTGNNATQTIPSMPTSANCLLDDANIGSSNSTTTDVDSYPTGGDIYFKFGTLTNNDRDADNEYVIVEFNALMDNTTTGSNDYNDTRTNTFVTHLNGSDVGGNSGDANVVVAEPCIGTATGSPPTACTSGPNKTLVTPPSPADAGGTAAYRIVMANATGTSISPAYDVRLTDVAPAGMSINTGSVTTNFSGCTPATPGVTNNSTAAQIDLSITVMTPGCQLTVDYTANLQNGILAGSNIVNTATVIYTSLPGTGTPNGSGGNNTGSTTPGNSGDSDGERNGSGGINDYSGSDPATLSTAAPEIDKIKPVPELYAPGQAVTYNLLVTMPEGTTKNLVVDDDLPTGMQFVAGSVQVITTAAASGGLLTVDFNGTLPGAPAITAPGGDGGNVTLTWTGNTVVPGDNNTANNAFLVRFQATVLDVPANVANKVLTNTVYVRYTDGDNVQQTPDQDSETIVVARPGINVEKTADPTLLFTPGGSVTYTVVVQNADGGSIHLTTLNDDKFGNIANPANPSITGTTCSLPQDIPQGGSYTCTFTATLLSAAVGTSHTNTVTGSGTGLGDTPVSDSDDATVRIVASSSFGVTKLVNSGSGYASASGWQFSGTVTITQGGQNANDYDWEAPLPAGDAAIIGTTKTATTDGVGQAYWTWWPGSKANPQFWTSQFVLNETMQAGHAFVNAECTRQVREQSGAITTTTFEITTLPATVPATAYGSIVTCIVHNVRPALEVVKTANPTLVVAPGGNVTFTIQVTNTGGGPVTLSQLNDDKFGNITQVHGAIQSTTCVVPQSLDEDEVYTCSFVATVSGSGAPPQDHHINTVTASGTGTGDVPVSDTDDANVTITPSICPTGAESHSLTDIIGIGMGTETKHKTIAKIVVPRTYPVTALYGQLAGKDYGRAKYVRFIYPNNTYVQVGTVTSPASQTWGVLWYGTALNPSAANIRGRWFLMSTGTKYHLPRAFILYPTYQTPAEYVNVFELVDGTESQVYWDTANGWTPSRQLILSIPAPLGPANLTVKLAIVDNDKLRRPVDVTVSAGNVTQTQTVMGSNKGEELDIVVFNLTGVPQGTAQVVIDLVSHAPNTNGLGALGGDSVSIVGMTANYACLP